MLAVAFFTLLERKLLGISQLRVGPNKTSISGVIQPMLDGLKLFKKINIKNFKLFKIFYFIVSFIIFTVILFLLNYLPYGCWPNKIIVFIYLFFILGLSRFTLILLGWSSLRKFATLGRVRSLCQTIRFEINFGILVILLFTVKRKLSIRWARETFSVCSRLVFLLILTLSVIETQRAPFDLREGERELVRGYNVEFRSVFFILIFLAEYLSVIIISLILVWTAIKSRIYTQSLILRLILVVRTCFPRQRFDSLLYFRWVKLLPCSLIFYSWFYVTKIL